MSLLTLGQEGEDPPPVDDSDNESMATDVSDSRSEPLGEGEQPYLRRSMSDQAYLELMLDTHTKPTKQRILADLERKLAPPSLQGNQKKKTKDYEKENQLIRELQLRRTDLAAMWEAFESHRVRFTRARGTLQWIGTLNDETNGRLVHTLCCK
jgi:hypothetical protein